MEKIGFFGGTFDPIHFGHLNLIVEIFERCQIDRILICPVNVSPTKLETPPIAGGEHRLKMIELAVEKLSYVSITDIELGKSAPSFTVETLESLLKNGRGEKEFYLLIGEDAICEMDKWKNIEELMLYVTPIIATRYGFKAQKLVHFSSRVKSKLEEGQVKILGMDISSKKIRERLKKGRYCGHLVPAKVLDYIYENHLYSAS